MLWFGRCQSLQIQFDLNQCHRPTSTDINEHRAQRRTWQYNINLNIQRITLELIVNIFRCSVFLCVFSRDDITAYIHGIEIRTNKNTQNSAT